MIGTDTTTDGTCNCCGCTGHKNCGLFTNVNHHWYCFRHQQYKEEQVIINGA